MAVECRLEYSFRACERERHRRLPELGHCGAHCPIRRELEQGHETPLEVFRIVNRIANSGVAHLKLNNIIINSILLCFNKYYQVLEIDRNRLEASYEWRDLRPCLGFLQSG